MSNRLLSDRTRRLLRFDLRRAWTRLWGAVRVRREVRHTRLHFGCGNRYVDGWLNVDVVGGDWAVDLAAGNLPWPDKSFEVAVGQHVIEHLSIDSELLPLFGELLRVLRPGGQLWVSCPDMEKICKAYVQDRLPELIEDRRVRFPDYTIGEWPVSHFLNEAFHQGGMHKNLFDLELLRFVLERVGFVAVSRVDESTFLSRVGDFPARCDDRQSLYVKAVRPA